VRSLPWVGLAVGLLLLGFYALTRVRWLRGLAPLRPATTYAEALARLQHLQAQEAAAILDCCRTYALTHGQRTPRAIVFLHGFTNCPYQFHQLAEQFYAVGYNVLNVRLPRHGLQDRRAPGFDQLTAEEMVDLTNAVIDLACGLGEQVTVLGFSLGGILAGWAAQHRADVDQAVLVSPAVGLRPPILHRQRLIANLLARWPDFFQWWDPVRKADKSGPPHMYWGFSSRALSQLLRLGVIVREEATQAKPAARSILVITNPTDELVAEPVVAQLVATWRRQGAAIQTYAFPVDWQLIHDLMDPSQPQQQVGRVYPQLLAWVHPYLAHDKVTG
jgi:pimeloyl-ACP methyl ester carboxylesterase